MGTASRLVFTAVTPGEAEGWSLHLTNEAGIPQPFTSRTEVIFEFAVNLLF